MKGSCCCAAMKSVAWGRSGKERLIIFIIFNILWKTKARALWFTITSNYQTYQGIYESQASRRALVFWPGRKMRHYKSDGNLLHTPNTQGYGVNWLKNSIFECKNALCFVIVNKQRATAVFYLSYEKKHTSFHIAWLAISLPKRLDSAAVRSASPCYLGLDASG